MGLKLSPKQADYYLSSTRPTDKIVIYAAEGSVRSGKTYITNLAWLDDVLHAPPGTLLLSGRTKDSVRENVLEDIFRIVGEENYRYFEAKGILYLFGRRIEVFGAEKADAEPRIRGRTYAGWYADEVTVQHKKFVQQALLRCSIPGARIRWTMNPDHPKHFVKTDFLDNEKLLAQGLLKSWHFTMDDNFTLDESYREMLRSSYSGVAYLRYVLGLWAIAEGLVYGNEYDQNRNKLPRAEVERMIADGVFAYYIAGTDWGYTHPMTGLIFGVIPTWPEPVYVQVAEFYEKRKRTEDLGEWYRAQLVRLGQEIRVIYCDSAEPDRIITLRKMGLKAKGVNKHDQLSAGINTVGVLLKTGRLKIADDCTNTEMEFQTYRYPDPDQVDHPRDVPLDQDNHAMDAMRYALHDHEMHVLAMHRREQRLRARQRVMRV